MTTREMAAQDKLDQQCINTIRTLAMDAVQQANSGHPGTPMAMAPVIYCLWQRFLRFDLEDPIWSNHDRFFFQWVMLREVFRTSRNDT